MSAYQFDATQHTPAIGGNSQAWPQGRYPVIVSSSEIKASRSQEGKVLHIQFKAIDGPMKDKNLPHTINVTNKNDVAQRIGQNELSLLCYCCGLLKIQDTAELHGRPMMIEVETVDQIHKDDKNKPVSEQRTVTFNNVTAMFKADGTLPVAGSVAAPASGPPPSFVTQQQVAPAPTPAAPAFVPPPAPIATAPDYRMFFVAHNGANINPTAPMNAEGVHKLNLPMDQIQVCVVDGSTVGPWTPGTQAFGAVAPAPIPVVAPSGAPPWAQPK